MKLFSILVSLFVVGCGQPAVYISQPDPVAPVPTPSASIVDIVDPCGDSPGRVDEVLLILADGRVLVSFSDSANGANTRLALLPPGNYVTTDGSNCVFSVGTNGAISF